jgi:hypothetical protein
MSGKSPPSKSPITKTSNSTPRQKSGSTTRGKSPLEKQQQIPDRVRSAKSRQSQSPKLKGSASPSGKKRQSSAASQKQDNDERKVDASNENANLQQPSQLSSRAFTEHEEIEEPVVCF